jgi:LEA14-like dessication related protein
MGSGNFSEGDVEMRRYSFLIIPFLILCVAGCETIQEGLSSRKPTARITDLKIKDAGLDSATLVFDVEIENHYPVELPLTNFDYSLTSSSEEFLSGDAASQAVIPAGSSRTVSLPARIDYVGMLKALSNVRPGSTIPYGAQLGLSVKAPGLGVIKLPLRKEGELALPDITGGDIIDILETIRPK